MSVALLLPGFASTAVAVIARLAWALPLSEPPRRRALLPLPPVGLENYDGWILGMSVTGDGRLLVSGDTWGDTGYVFDAQTGAIEGIVAPVSPVMGLACVDRR